MPFPPPAVWDIISAEVFDQVSQHVPVAEVRRVVRVSADPQRHTAWLQDYLDLGFDALSSHHVGQDPTEFLETFGAQVLPQLSR